MGATRGGVIPGKSLPLNELLVPKLASGVEAAFTSAYIVVGSRPRDPGGRARVTGSLSGDLLERLEPGLDMIPGAGEEDRCIPLVSWLKGVKLSRRTFGLYVFIGPDDSDPASSEAPAGWYE
jgi:hypothetical protein